MTKYQEMAAAAANARREFASFRDRSMQNLDKLVIGLLTYCEIPHAQITFLRWNGLTGDDRTYTEAEPGGMWGLPGATEFDESDGYWHLGLSITLSKPGTFPDNWVAFAICVSEEQGKTLLKVGAESKPQSLDFSDATGIEAVYQNIVDQIVTRFTDMRRKSVPRSIGFEVNTR